MKKNRIMGMIVTAMIVSPLCAQDWNRIPGGDVINSTDYIGARAGSTVPLLLKTIPNLSVDLATSNTLRMRLNPTLSTTINGFAGARNGFLLLSGQPNAFTNANNRAPFTRLHLVDDAGTPNDPVVYAQELGYRPWMRNGITFTGNSDQAYVGHKYFDQVNGSPVNDNTDFVIQWSDNPNGSGWGVDRLKFVFSTTYNAGTVKGAAAFNGMEAMRFWPSSMTTVNVGIGDFAPVGTGDPTERVDILDGRLRIRQLPDDLPANTLTKVLVVDDAAAPSGQRGVVKWRDISAINCSSGWSLTGNNACTAYNGNPCPPQAADRVGIGTSAPIAKLEVIKTNVFGLLGQPNRGIYAHLTGNGLVVNIAVDGHADGTTSGNTTNIGVRGLAENNAPLNYGLQGVAQGAATNNLGAFVSGTGGYRSYGVQAAASGGSSNNYGIYASATG
ncbi:MAG TPA: hypothetical protein VHL57_00905, partial [Flavobacteriales bacterium]|nr:hypothetical protein [Flavobacteriales bacterium]